MSVTHPESDRTRQLRERYETFPVGDSRRGSAYDAWKNAAERDQNPEEWVRYDNQAI